MPTLLVSYDLADTAARHELTAEIMRIGQSWARPLASTWYLRTDESAADVRRRLAPVLGADDGLVVQEVGGDWALINTTLRWFRQRRADAIATSREGDGADNVIAFPVVSQASDQSSGDHRAEVSDADGIPPEPIARAG